MNTKTSAWGRVDHTANPNDFAAYLDTVTTLGEIQRYKEKTFKLLQPRSGARLLDVGCGVGDDVRTLADLVGWHGSVIGIDNSATFIQEAQQRHGDGCGRFEFRVGEAGRLPFDDQTFDGCRADRVFMHLPDRDAALREMMRVTRPGGRLVVNDPDWDTLIIDHPDLALTRAVLQAISDHTTHSRSGRELYGLFLAHGLKQVAIADTATLVLTDFATANRLFLIEERVDDMIYDGRLAAPAGQEWLGQLHAADQNGSFFAAVTGFTVVGQTV